MKLKNKFLILFFIVVLVISLICLSFFFIQYKTNIINSRKATCITLINGIKRDIIYTAVINNKNLTKLIINSFLKINFIEKIEIYKNGKLFFSVKKNSLPAANRLFSVKKQFANINKFKTKNILVTIYFSIDDCFAVLKQFVANFIFLIFFILIVLFFITQHYINKFLSPVDYLLGKILECQKGAYVTLDIIPSKDFQPIFKSYNNLITTLKKREEEILNKVIQLEKTNNSLEQKIHEIQKLQDLVIKQEKLATLGTITSGIAHEINNPVAAIRGLSELAILKNDKENNEKYFKTIISHCDRIKDIVKSIKNFNRKINENDVTEVLLREIIDEVIMLIRTAKILPATVTVKGNYNMQDYKIFCVRNQIFQVFQNLFINSVQAMDGKGEIVIDVTDNNDLLFIVFSDTGKGIPTSVRNKIFDPFFSTKGTKGTGLGLYIVYNIIKQHKGEIILLDSEKGAKFQITLPLNLNKINNNGVRNESHGN